MEKTLFSKDYALFLKHLRATRQQKGLTQVEVARRIGQNQSFVSKCERGERRVDVIELRYFCQAMGISFETFISQLAYDLERKVHH